MKSKDIVSDLALLEHRREDHGKLTMPWTNTRARPTYYHDYDHRESNENLAKPVYPDNVDLPHSNNSSFRHGQSSDLHNIPEDDNEESAKVLPLHRTTFQNVKTDENSEYEKMKMKFMSSLENQKKRITQSISVGRSSQSDVNLRKQMLLNNIKKFRQGDGFSFGNPKEMSIVREQHEVSEAPSLSYYQDMRRNRLDSSHLPPPVMKRRLVPVRQPEPEYAFNTKKLTDDAKLDEYDQIRKWKKQNDFLQESKKRSIKVNQDQQELKNVSKLEAKKGNQSKFNNESQKMVISKVSAIDNKAEMSNIKHKYGVSNPQMTGQREDGYIDSIKLKMQLLSGMLEK